MIRTVASTLLAMTLALPVFAGEVAGIKMPESVSVNGKQLVLNGMGLRTKFMFKVYVAGLYVEQKSHEPAQIIGADQSRQVRMVMKRDLGKDKIAEAVEEGFEKNNKASMPALKDRLQRFIAAIPDLESGQELVITYVPGHGTTLSSSAGTKLNVEGKDFADALFSVWLGASPVDEGLKKAMLGG